MKQVSSSFFSPFIQKQLDSIKGYVIKNTYESPPFSRLETDNFIILLESQEGQLITIVLKKVSKTGKKSTCLKEYEYCLDLYNYNCISKIMSQENQDFWERNNQLEGYQINDFIEDKYSNKEPQSQCFDVLSINIAHPERDNNMIDEKGQFLYYTSISLSTYVEEEDEISLFFEKGEKRVCLYCAFN